MSPACSTCARRKPFTVYASRRVLDVLAANTMFDVLARAAGRAHRIAARGPTPLKGAGVDLGLTVEAFAVPGRSRSIWRTPPLARTRQRRRATRSASGSPRRPPRAFFYIPGCATIDERLAERSRAPLVVFFDGTLWHENEMIDRACSARPGTRMGHINMSGRTVRSTPSRSSRSRARYFVHINNSNPVLRRFLARARESDRGRRLGNRLGRDGDRAMNGPVLGAQDARTLRRADGCRRSSKPRSARSAPSAITTSIRSIKCCMAASSTRAQVQAWALNRYCYQEAVPRKDAAFISRAA